MAFKLFRWHSPNGMADVPDSPWLTGARFLFSVTELINDSFHVLSLFLSLLLSVPLLLSSFLLVSLVFPFALKLCLFTRRDSVVVPRKVVKHPCAHAHIESNVILMRFISFCQHQSRLHTNFSPRATTYFRKSAASLPEVPLRRRHRLGRSLS